MNVMLLTSLCIYMFASRKGFLYCYSLLCLWFINHTTMNHSHDKMALEGLFTQYFNNDNVY